jgi:hypothetical protein
MAGELTPDKEAFRATVIKRFGDALRPCLEEAIGKDIREHEAWPIVSAELINLASLYAIQIGSTADKIAAITPFNRKIEVVSQPEVLGHALGLTSLGINVPVSQ